METENDSSSQEIELNAEKKSVGLTKTAVDSGYKAGFAEWERTAMKKEELGNKEPSELFEHKIYKHSEVGVCAQFASEPDRTTFLLNKTVCFFFESNGNFFVVTKDGTMKRTTKTFRKVFLFNDTHLYLETNCLP